MAGANLAGAAASFPYYAAQFKKNIEDNKLYEVLYGENEEPRPEVFGQRLFYAIADSYCAANDVDLSREPNPGNGPVDFTLSVGYHGRVLVEIKKSMNPRLLHGFETQLDACQKAEATQQSLYLILRVSEGETGIKDVFSSARRKTKEKVKGSRCSRNRRQKKAICFETLKHLTPFDTSWMKGSGATPLTTQDLFLRDELINAHERL